MSNPQMSLYFTEITDYMQKEGVCRELSSPVCFEIGANR